jgi:hypothetical protein
VNTIPILERGELPPSGWDRLTDARQPFPYPLRDALRSLTDVGWTVSRWQPLWRERVALLFGGSVWLTMKAGPGCVAEIRIAAARQRPIGLRTLDDDSPWTLTKGGA